MSGDAFIAVAVCTYERTGCSLADSAGTYESAREHPVRSRAPANAAGLPGAMRARLANPLGGAR